MVAFNKDVVILIVFTVLINVADKLLQFAGNIGVEVNTLCQNIVILVNRAVAVNVSEQILRLFCENRCIIITEFGC